MSKLTKIVIASALAVAVTAPASAQPKFPGCYVGDKLRVQINPQGCKNFKTDKLPGSIQFFPNDEFRQSGWWDMDGFTVFGGGDLINGSYVERKVDKELTGALLESDLGFCENDPLDDPDLGLECFGIAEAVQSWLVFEGCGAMTEAQSFLMRVTRGQVKLSKDTDRTKADFVVEGEYLNDDLNAKKFKVMVKSPNMDFVPGAIGGPLCADILVVDPL